MYFYFHFCSLFPCFFVSICCLCSYALAQNKNRLFCLLLIDFLICCSAPKCKTSHFFNFEFQPHVHHVVLPKPFCQHFVCVEFESEKKQKTNVFFFNTLFLLCVCVKSNYKPQEVHVV